MKRDEKFYLIIFQQLKQGFNPATISKNLNISKQALNYYLSSLKRAGIIRKIGYGTWEIIKDFDEKEVKSVTPYRLKHISLTPNKVRGHAFVFKFKIKPHLRNWNKREDIFKNMGITYQKIKNKLGNSQKLEFKGRNIICTDKSIIIYEKSSYFAETSKESKSYAIISVLELIKQFENRIKADLGYGKGYKFKICRNHYSLIKNSLAEQYDREGKKLNIYNDKGLWFVIDNSFNLHEAETLHPKTADSDSKKVQNFFNGLKEVDNFTPQEVYNMLGKVTTNQDEIGKNQQIFADNMLSHIEAVKKLGLEVEGLSKAIKEFKNE